MFFQKGTPMLYAGQERMDANQPSLFDRDPVNWNGADISEELRQLARFKKEHYPEDACFSAEADDEKHIIVATAEGRKASLCGVFSLKAEAADVKVDAADGIYADLISGEAVEVKNGCLHTDGRPVIFRMK